MTRGGGTRELYSPWKERAGHGAQQISRPNRGKAWPTRAGCLASRVCLVLSIRVAISSASRGEGPERPDWGADAFELSRGRSLAGMGAMDDGPGRERAREACLACGKTEVRISPRRGITTWEHWHWQLSL